MHGKDVVGNFKNILAGTNFVRIILAISVDPLSYIGKLIDNKIFLIFYVTESEIVIGIKHSCPGYDAKAASIVK